MLGEGVKNLFSVTNLTNKFNNLISFKYLLGGGILDLFETPPHLHIAHELDLNGFHVTIWRCVGI